MRYVASSFGSAGDFLPTLAVAHALHLDGHEVVFVTNPFHEDAVRATGMTYVPAGERVDIYQRIVDQPDILRTFTGLRVIVEELAPVFFSASYRVAREIVRDAKPAAVVGSNLAYGALWAAAERHVPSVIVAATPVSWWRADAPEQFLDFAIPERILPHVMGATRAVLAGLADAALRSLARTVSATSFDPSLTALERGAALHLGMWPELVRPRARSDAPNMHAVGFARAGHLGASVPSLSAPLEAFLGDGTPPVVVGLGSIFSLGSDDVIADAAEACAELGRRCVIVGPPPRERPLPEGTFVAPYAAYHLLFPRAHALVIHGGAGTTGEALRAGRPAVVVPFAFDQFGISWQVQRLGTGVRVAMKRRTGAAIRDAVRAVCENDAMHARAVAVADILGPAPDGAERAAELILRLPSASSGR